MTFAGNAVAFLSVLSLLSRELKPLLYLFQRRSVFHFQCSLC